MDTGNVQEAMGTQKRVMTFKVSRREHRRIQSAALDEGVSMSEFIRRRLRTRQSQTSVAN